MILTYLNEMSSNSFLQAGMSSSKTLFPTLILAESFIGSSTGALLFISEPHWKSSVLIPWKIQKSFVNLQ